MQVLNHQCEWFIFISCRSFHKSKSCISNRRNHCNSYTNVSNATTDANTVRFTNWVSKATTDRVTSTNRGTCTTGVSSVESTSRYACKISSTNTSTNASTSRNAKTFTTTNAYTNANTYGVFKTQIFPTLKISSPPSVKKHGENKIRRWWCFVLF